MADEYLEQAIRNLGILVSDGRYKEAYMKCGQLLERFPENRSLLAVKRKIEEEVLIENNKIIDREVVELEKKMDDGEVAGALVKMRELKKLNPNHKKLQALYEKAQKQYLELMEKSAKNFKEAQLTRMNEILEKRPNDLMDELYVLQSNNPGNKLVMEVAATMKDRLIAKMIEEKRDLLYSDKFEAVENFLENLKAIDSDSPRIKELEPLVKGWKFEHQTNKKMEFVYKGKNHLMTLLKLKKYDKALKVAEEILELEPGSKDLQQLRDEAEQKLFIAARDACVEAINKNLPTLKEAYNQDPSKFLNL